MTLIDQMHARFTYPGGAIAFIRHRGALPPLTPCA